MRIFQFEYVKVAIAPTLNVTQRLEVPFKPRLVEGFTVNKKINETEALEKSLKSQ